jgi:hypothetical protein
MALYISVKEEEGVDDVVGCDAPPWHDVRRCHSHLPQR